MKFKEPVKGCASGRGFRILFRKNGFETYLVDEFRTSKTCCNCLNSDTCYYKKRENPKPFRDGEVNVHGLLNCKNCSKSCHLHLINRDINGSKIFYIY